VKSAWKFAPVLLMAVILCGCREDAEMSAFYDHMDSFYESLSQTTSSLEAINPSSETAVDEVLIKLDELEQLFVDLSEINVPEKFEEQFGNVEELADQALEYMQEAKDVYEEAYSAKKPDESMAEAAEEYYSRAMKRVNYIAQFLQGQVPEGADITVVHTEEEPDWTGGE